MKCAELNESINESIVKWHAFHETLEYVIWKEKETIHVQGDGPSEAP